MLEDLKAGGVSAADRAKIRVLVGDQEHLRRLDSGGSWWILMDAAFIGSLRSLVACVRWLPVFTGCLRSLVACVHLVFTWVCKKNC